MGGKPSKESALDKLQDSRDAMKTRDMQHLAKEGVDTNIEYVPRQGPAPVKQNDGSNSNKSQMRKTPSIQCTE
jgi:hypothetical protein